MQRYFITTSIILCAALMGCGGQVPNSGILRDSGDQTCFREIITPAVIETITQQIEIKPGQYETHIKPVMIRERSVTRIDLVCPEDQTPAYIASLQRAFQARGLYLGQITGTFTPDTRAALRDFQKARGNDYADLTLATAQELGLAVVPVAR